jgi:hypothetical protein
MVYEESASVRRQLIVTVGGAGLPATAYVKDTRHQANCITCTAFILTSAGLGETVKTKEHYS